MRIISNMFQRGFRREYAWAYSSSSTSLNTTRFIKDSLDSSIFLLDYVKRKA